MSFVTVTTERTIKEEAPHAKCDGIPNGFPCGRSQPVPSATIKIVPQGWYEFRIYRSEERVSPGQAALVSTPLFCTRPCLISYLNAMTVEILSA